MTLEEEIQATLEKALPQAEVTIRDMTGGGDHFEVIVLSPVFRGKMLIEQHQLVHAALEPLKDRIHAVKIKILAP
jgi:acid stress-induced BolA-like protein IbaG/YrbA